MRLIALVTAACLPMTAFAAGSDDFSPPKPSDTVKKCWGKRVYDTTKGRCVSPKNSSFSDDQLFQAVRELAYAGRTQDAQAILAAMSDQSESRVMTYWGFTHRKLGNRDLAFSYYTAALEQDPGNLLARSYYGQGLVEDGRLGDALAQWKEIRARGGIDTWAETSLRDALSTGRTSSY